jgi:replication factor C subunit 3/5
MAYDIVNEENVHWCTGHPQYSDIANIMTWMLNDDFTTAVKSIAELKELRGVALQDILTEVHLFVHKIDFPQHIRIIILNKIAEVEYRLASGTSEKIQLSSLVAAFQTARNMIGKDHRSLDSH